MFSDVERLAGCMMYIKEAMYISQSQQVQHCWYGLLLMPQVTTTIPSLCYTSKVMLLIIAQPAGVTPGAPLASVALALARVSHALVSCEGHITVVPQCTSVL